MKISTTWSQRDWDDALKKVWKLSDNFEEILVFGLEHGFITSSDIINVSDMYKDPNKEYDDEELKEILDNSNIYDIMKILQEKYSLDEIIDELPANRILENIDEDERLDSLCNTWTLDRHDEEVRDQTYREYIDEWIDECKTKEKDTINNLYNANGDTLHTLLCDIIGCSYFDQEGLNKGLEKIKEKLNKNSYGIKYEK